MLPCTYEGAADSKRITVLQERLKEAQDEIEALKYKLRQEISSFAEAPWTFTTSQEKETAVDGETCWDWTYDSDMSVDGTSSVDHTHAEPLISASM